MTAGSATTAGGVAGVADVPDQLPGADPVADTTSQMGLDYELYALLLATGTYSTSVAGVTTFDFDIGVIGGGAAGLTVTAGAAQLGAPAAPP